MSTLYSRRIGSPLQFSSRRGEELFAESFRFLQFLMQVFFIDRVASIRFVTMGFSQVAASKKRRRVEKFLRIIAYENRLVLVLRRVRLFSNQKIIDGFKDIEAGSAAHSASRSS